MTIMLLIRSRPYISRWFDDIQNITLVHSFPLKTGKKLLSLFNKCGYWYSEIKRLTQGHTGKTRTRTNIFYFYQFISQGSLVLLILSCSGIQIHKNNPN